MPEHSFMYPRVVPLVHETGLPMRRVQEAAILRRTLPGVELGTPSHEQKKLEAAVAISQLHPVEAVQTRPHAA